MQNSSSKKEVMILPFANCTTGTDEDLANVVVGLLLENGLHVSVVEEGVSKGSVRQLGRSRPKAAIVIMVNERDETHDVCERGDEDDDLSAKPAVHQILKGPTPIRERRNEAANNASKRIEVDRLTIDQSRHICTLDGQGIDLTTAEFELLWLLAEHAGSIVSRHRLHQELLGLKYDGQDRSIDLRVSRLRKKLKDDPNCPQLIKSVRGVGYLLAAPCQ
jgi:DNA-binding response OmpR family regulator